MFLNKESLLSKFPRFDTHQDVYCSDGERLGRIAATNDTSFTVQKGVFFPKDFTLRYDDISDVRDDKIFIRESSDEMKDWRTPGYSGWNKVEQVNVGKIEPIPTSEYREKYQSIAEDQVDIPVFEEELEVNKRMRSGGKVTVRKVVHSELKHLTVPLVHEEVRIERVPVDRTSADRFKTEDSFSDQTVSMEVMDEEAEITKRPVVREEVRLHKTRRFEDKEMSDEVRKEDVEIDDQTEQRPGMKRKAG